MTASPDPQTAAPPSANTPPATSTEPPHPDDPQARRFLRRIAVLATFGGLLFGYDTGVISGALPFMQFDQRPLTPLEEGTVVSSLLFGAALGSFAGGRIADRRGRRLLIAALAVVFVVAALACAFAPTIGVMIAARFALGLAVGGASVVVPMLMKSDELLGMRAAAAAPIACFSTEAIARRASYLTFSLPLGKSAPPWMRVRTRVSQRSFRSLRIV